MGRRRVASTDGYTAADGAQRRRRRRRRGAAARIARAACCHLACGAHGGAVPPAGDRGCGRGCGRLWAAAGGAARRGSSALTDGDDGARRTARRRGTQRVCGVLPWRAPARCIARGLGRARLRAWLRAEAGGRGRRGPRRAHRRRAATARTADGAARRGGTHCACGVLLHDGQRPGVAPRGARCARGVLRRAWRQQLRRALHAPHTHARHARRVLLCTWLVVLRVAKWIPLYVWGAVRSW